MDRSSLNQQIQETERQLEILKLKLLNYKIIEGAGVGDEIEDGSIVLVKGENHAIVVCPKEKEFQSNWDDIKYRFGQIKYDGGQFDPEWFIPSKDLLMLAHKQIPQFFSEYRYWSSSEFNFLDAHIVNVNQGFTNVFPKNTVCSVRPFNVLTF